MRRPPIAGLVIGVALAAAPLAGHAASPPNVTVIAPVSEDSTSGDLLVKWSYRALHPTTPVYVDVLQGTTVLQHNWVDDIDDGTKGSFGSYTLSTSSLDEAGNYVVRVVVASNLKVTSAVSDVGVDRTGASSAVDAEPVTDPLPAAVILADVTGTAADAVAGVASVAVTFDGPDTVTVPATCGDCGPRVTSVEWSAPTDGLAPGQYTVTAVATDIVGNVGGPSDAELVIVGMPEDPTPALLATATTTATAVIEAATTTTESLVETATTTPTAGAVGETVATATEDAIEAATTTTTAGEVVELVTTTAGGGS